jgi:predicted SAM-dependent methyltransferase
VNGIKQLVLPRIRLWRHRISYYLFYRGTERFCPICEKSSSKFLPMVWKQKDATGRENVKCPYCYSFERHRLLYLFLRRKTDILTETRRRQVVHVAPEPCLRSVFKKILGAGYRTADLGDPTVDIKMDICNIEFPDDSLDVILCSHVLEHVTDDQRAMREFSRTLKPEGVAVIMVPVNAEKTFEDWSITDPDERNRVFGMDHVRRYGPDVEDRLRANHFEVVATHSRDFLSAEEMERMGIIAEECVYLCRKAGGAG